MQNKHQTNFSSNFQLTIGDRKYTHCLSIGSALFVTREEVPRSTVTETRELERRQKARQVEPGELEELWGGGIYFSNKKYFNLMLRGPARRPRHLQFAWRRSRVAQWKPADYCYSDCWHPVWSLSLFWVVFTFLYCLLFLQIFLSAWRGFERIESTRPNVKYKFKEKPFITVDKYNHHQNGK